MDFPAGLPWADLSVNGVLLVLAAWPVWAIFTGRLVTRREATAVQRAMQANCDAWQRAAEQRSAQLNTILAATDISTRVLEAFENPPDTETETTT